MLFCYNMSEQENIIYRKSNKNNTRPVPLLLQLIAYSKNIYALSWSVRPEQQHVTTWEVGSMSWE